MGKLKNNQDGFGAMELLLVLLIVVVLGLIGWFVYKNHNKTTADSSSTAATTSPSQSTTKTVTTDPYAGWKTSTLKYEKISYKYPPTWTLTDNSISESQANTNLAAVNCTLKNGQDLIVLTAPNKDTVAISTGLECRAGAQLVNNYVGFTPIKTLGGNYYIAYETSPNDSSKIIDSSITTSKTIGYDFPASKNISGSSSPYNRFAFTPTGMVDVNGGSSLTDFQKSANFTTAQLIFKSMSY